VEASICCFDFQHGIGIGINYGRIKVNPSTRFRRVWSFQFIKLF